jgi:hypothetical protein
VTASVQNRMPKHQMVFKWFPRVDLTKSPILISAKCLATRL